MKRLVYLGLLALCFAVAGCTDDQAPSPAVTAAAPRTVALDWSEPLTDADATVVFGVSTLRVTKTGWEADLSMANHSQTRFEIPVASDSSDREFGLMVLGNGSLEELDDLMKRGKTPPVRGARETRPATPAVLMPGATWRGTISAPGALPVGGWVRVSFGPLTPIDKPPAGVEDRNLHVGHRPRVRAALGELSHVEHGHLLGLGPTALRQCRPRRDDHLPRDLT